MFPNTQFLGMEIYYWLFLIGVLTAMGIFRVFSGKAGLSAKVFNLSVIAAAAAVVLGYISSLLFESWYEYLATGVFEWGAGSTFYGGLIGATLVYLLVYFLAGHFLFKDKSHIREFGRMLSLIVPCIVVAHAFGRIGCLFNGCCYGRITEGFGIDMYVHREWQHRVPVQLYEALFLFALFIVLLVLLFKFKFAYNASLYLIVYGVWRFCIEFARDDDRGASGIAALTPSQLTAIILIVIGIAFFFLWKYILKNRFARAGATGEKAE